MELISSVADLRRAFEDGEFPPSWSAERCVSALALDPPQNLEIDQTKRWLVFLARIQLTSIVRSSRVPFADWSIENLHRALSLWSRAYLQSDSYQELLDQAKQQLQRRADQVAKQLSEAPGPLPTCTGLAETPQVGFQTCDKSDSLLRVCTTRELERAFEYVVAGCDDTHAFESHLTAALFRNRYDKCLTPAQLRQLGDVYPSLHHPRHEASVKRTCDYVFLGRSDVVSEAVVFLNAAIDKWWDLDCSYRKRYGAYHAALRSIGFSLPEELIDLTVRYMLTN